MLAQQEQVPKKNTTTQLQWKTKPRETKLRPYHILQWNQSFKKEKTRCNRGWGLTCVEEGTFY